MKIINNKSALLNRRRELRNNPTPEESMLWARLKNYQTGFKFRRQHSIGGYIVDFYCASQRMVVELDGPQHLRKESLEYDEIRSRYFKAFNIKLIRFVNDEVKMNLDNVVLKIKNMLHHHPQPPPPKGVGVVQ